jgi:hypothetical protein
MHDNLKYHKAIIHRASCQIQNCVTCREDVLEIADDAADDRWREVFSRLGSYTELGDTRRIES